MAWLVLGLALAHAVEPDAPLGGELLDDESLLAETDPAKADAIAQYAERWLAVGKVSTVLPPGMYTGGVPLPATEIVGWGVYQAGDQLLYTKQFVRALRAEDFDVRARFCGGPVSHCFELERAVALTRAYNAALLGDLGLTHDDVAAVEMMGPAAAWSPGVREHKPGRTVDVVGDGPAD